MRAIKASVEPLLQSLFGEFWRIFIHPRVKTPVQELQA
jgi:hypothetical protein